MRAETANPPKMLTAARTTAASPQISTNMLSAFPATPIAPRMITPEMAFDTLISGEYSAGVTPQTTK